MKKQSIQSRLQAQYNKLNNRIQKSIKTGRFYQYTQFKRDQLFGRLERYALQMKRLSMGLGLVAALGVATPVVGQVTQFNLVERIGTANPLDGVNVRNLHNPNEGRPPVFVDIDGDGDLDFFIEKSISATNPINEVKYFENVGNANTAIFQEMTGASNPLDGIGDGEYLSFVDIDNDGDMDCFRGNNAYLYTPANNNLYYYKNDGTASLPNFVLQASTANPLDSVVHHLGTVSTYSVAPMTTFSDIDNDGDMDCIVGLSLYGSTPANNSVWYYENTGTATTPAFLRREGSSNPFSGFMSSIGSLGSSIVLEGPLVIKDTDNDGDQDVLLSLLILPSSTVGFKVAFGENQGNATTPNFTLMNDTPIESAIVAGTGSLQYHTLVDIDGDTDLDVFRVKQQDSVGAFFENLDTTIVSLTKIESENEIGVFPNPSQGKINFDKNISGELILYSLLGQVLYKKELDNDTEVDLSKLDNGIYFMNIVGPKKEYRKTIILEK